MKLLKRGAWIAGALVVLVIGGVWLNLAHIVKTEVEKESTKSLRLTTTLGSASIALFGGKLGLHGLAIESPHGFSAPRMLELGDIDVGVRYRELRNDPIHIGALNINRPKLVIEQSGGLLNFRKAMEVLPASDPNKPPMKLVIDTLELRDAQVVIRPGLPGVQQEIVVPVPALSMKDIGQGKGAHNGAAIREVAMRVMSALAEKAAESDKVPAELRALLHLNAAQLAGDLGRQLMADPSALTKDPTKSLQGFLPAGRPGPKH
jgi:hypothetical protein